MNLMICSAQIIILKVEDRVVTDYDGPGDNNDTYQSVSEQIVADYTSYLVHVDQGVVSVIKKDLHLPSWHSLMDTIFCVVTNTYK